MQMKETWNQKKEETISALRRILPEERVLLNEPLSGHTSFRCGGPAVCFVKIGSREELTEVIAVLQKEEAPFFILGRGTNVLADDAGFDGVIVQVAEGFDEITREGDSLRAQAGASIVMVSVRAKEAGLTGLEFACGIPGTVGGAMVMNAGAYGGEMKGVVKEVTLLFPDGSIRTLSCDEMEFGYRTSLLKKNPAVVLEAVFALTGGDKETIADTMEDLLQKRREKQPLEYPSAGSTFKRPEGYFAGALIEEAGLRGFSVGDAQVSEKHCGFVINRGEASSTDIKTLIAKVQEEVEKNSDIKLEREVIYL